LATAQMAPRYGRATARKTDVKDHRLRRGISLELICERTKISRHFLEAIEARDYGRLPGGIFDISYIRQYAEQIGYSADVLLEDYRSRKDGREPASHATNSAHEKTWWRTLL